MSVRLVNTEVFERLAYEVLLMPFDGDRNKYRSTDDDDSNQIKNHFSRLFRLNRLTYCYAVNNPVVINLPDMSFYGFCEKCSSVDVLKWINVIAANIDLKLVIKHTDITEDDRSAKNFLRRLLWDAMHNYGLDPKGAYQLGLKHIPLYATFSGACNTCPCF